MKKQELTRKKMFGYCLGDIFGGGAFTLVGMLYMNYLTDNILLSGALVAALLFIGKIWDAIIDPFIGNISEKAKSKLGRRRVFFLAGIFHISASFLALWMPLQQAPTWLKFIYFLFAYILFATSFSLTMVPYHAMLPELTDDLAKRNKTVSIRSIISNCSSMIAGLVPQMVISMVNGFAPGYGYLGMGVVFGLFYCLPWIFVFLSTKGIDLPNDTEETKPVEKKKSNFFKEFIQNAKTVLSNRSFRIMLGLYLLSYTAMDIFMAIIIYYVKWYLGAWGQTIFLGFGAYTFVLGVFMIAEVLSIIFYTKIATKKGKRFAFLISTGLWSAATILLFIMASPENFQTSVWFLIIPTALMGAGAGGVAYLPWAMLPETMDVEELKTGVRKDGVYSGFLTFIRQLSQAVALAIVGLFLDSVKYAAGDIMEAVSLAHSGVASTDIDVIVKSGWYAEVLSQIPTSMSYGLKLFTTIAPLVLLIGSNLVACLYPIDNKGYALLKREIAERNATDENEIKLLEKMTGSKYNNKNN